MDKNATSEPRFKHVLLTGATGYLGRHVLAALLESGCQVTALVRRRSGRLRERLDAVSPALRAVEGDVAAPGCGVAARDLETLRGAEAFVHCAGLTEFDEKLAEELSRQNLGGTRNAFALAASLGIPDFHHMSTAFVAGDAARVSGGDPDPLSFKNPYERSKFEAEKFLRSAHGPRVFLYRPGIVAGGKVLGEDGSAGTLYAYLKALRFVRECFRRDAREGGRLARRYGASQAGGVWRVPLRVEASGETRANLVHVRDVAAAVARGVWEPGEPGVCVLTSASVFTIAQMRDVFCRELSMEGVRVADGSEFLAERANPLESKFERMTRTFRPYLFGMPEFPAGEGLGAVSLEEVARDFLRELDEKDRRGPDNLGAIALECLDLQKPGRYLDRFSEGDFGESLLKRIPQAETRVSFRIVGEGAVSRTLCFKRGTVGPERISDASSADFSYKLDAAAFRQIVTGTLDPREAFFKGSLRISGNEELALKFGFAFTEHFKDIDRRILEELAGEGA